jgi:glycosyltransferase involved in cell wall biosynthesis
MAEALTRPDEPRLSVVIPTVNGLADLTGCLDALAVDARRTPLEAIVADRVGEGLRREISARYPWVRVLDAAPGTTIPQLRAMAFEAATAPIVAVIEDHVQVPPGWAEQMLAAHARGEEVVAGAVDNAATERLVDWAAFLCEYSHLLAPLPSGPVPSIAGNNTTYRRALLDRFRDAVTSGRWEDHLHEVLRANGVALHCHPEIAVGHKKHYTVWEYASQRYLYARSFAGARVRDRGLPARALYAGAAAVLLPPLLLARIVGRVWSRPPYRPMLLRSLPLLPVFVAAWAAGEVVGASFGPGNALSRVC